MLKILWLLPFLLVEVSHDDCTTFYLIRHAEKIRDDKSESNPDLNEKGVLRAQNWKNYFSDKEISKIYSTNYKRTLKTVYPLAIENGVQTIIYSPSDIKYDNFNTIPGFVNNLISDEYYGQIEDLNNSNLYIVSMCNSKITHKLIKVD